MAVQYLYLAVWTDARTPAGALEKRYSSANQAAFTQLSQGEQSAALATANKVVSST